MGFLHSDLFEISPISILCEDRSGVKRAVDEAIAGGVTDFDRFLDDNPQFFFDVRRFHRILDANRMALDLLGFQDKDAFLQESRVRLPANPASKAQVLKAMVRGGTVCQAERVLHTGDGRVVPILWRARLPGGAADPEAYGRLHFFAVDVTEPKRVQEALMAAQANLSHAGRLSLVGELAASLTHEVSQPLVSIAGHAAAATRWLARDVPNLDEVATSLNRITASTRHAVRVVAKMRSFARWGELVATQIAALLQQHHLQAEAVHVLQVQVGDQTSGLAFVSDEVLRRGKGAHPHPDRVQEVVEASPDAFVIVDDTDGGNTLHDIAFQPRSGLPTAGVASVPFQQLERFAPSIPAYRLTSAADPAKPDAALRGPVGSQALKKASRSALMISAWVVAMPCGKPL